MPRPGHRRGDSQRRPAPKYRLTATTDLPDPLRRFVLAWVAPAGPPVADRSDGVLRDPRLQTPAVWALRHLSLCAAISKRGRSARAFTDTRGLGSQAPRPVRGDFKTRPKRARLSRPGCVSTEARHRAARIGDLLCPARSLAELSLRPAQSGCAESQRTGVWNPKDQLRKELLKSKLTIRRVYEVPLFLCRRSCQKYPAQNW